MKRSLLLISLLSLLFQFGIANAQDTPPEDTPCLTFGVLPNATITIDVGCTSQGTMWVDAGDGVYFTVEVSTDWLFEPIHILTKGDYLKLYADIVNIEALYGRANLVSADVSEMRNLEWLDLEGNSLTSIDVSNNVKLQRLYLAENYIESIDVSNLVSLSRLWLRSNVLKHFKLTNTPSLSLVYADDNLMDACTLDSVYLDLHPTESSCYLVLSSVAWGNYPGGANPGIATSNTSIATELGWRVVRYIGGGSNFSDLSGDGTGCPSLGIFDLQANNISVFPNPAYDYLQIDAQSEILSVEVMDVLGRSVLRLDGCNDSNFSVPLSSLEEGCYFVCVKSFDGTLIQKVMVDR